MAEKLKKLLQAKWIRRIFVLMGCVLVLICSLAPAANAFIIVDGSTKLQPILSGTVSVQFYPTSDDDVDMATRVYPFGDKLPYISTTGKDYYGENVEDFVLNRLNDPEWSIETITRIARYKQNVTVLLGSKYSFDKIRYNLATYETVTGDRGAAYYRALTYRTDPYYFDEFDGSVFLYLFDLRLNQKRNIQTTVTFSYYDDNTNKVVTQTLTEIVKGVGSSNIQVFYPLESFVDGFTENDILYYIDESDPVLIESIECIVTPENYTDKISGVTFELLAEQWASGSPIYVRSDSTAAFITYVNSAIKRQIGTGSIVFPEVESGVYSRWLAGVVAGFFDVELIPGFSFGGIFKVIITILFVVAIVRFIGGG